MRKLSKVSLAVLLVAAILPVASAGAGIGNSTSAFLADLSGDNQVPDAVVTDASGFASFTVSADESTVDYRLYANDAVGVTQAHVHLAAAGVNGSPAVFLFGKVDPGVASDGLLAEGTFTGADLIPALPGFDGSMGQFLDRIRSGGAYVNLHTETNPGGEIRGQIGPAAFNFGADLSGDNQVPPLASDGTGFAAMSADGAQTTLDYVIISYGVMEIIQAHIHLEAADANGPVVAFLFGPADPAVTSDGILVRGSLTGADLIASGDFDGSMGQLLDRLRAGRAYVNVHTIANPGGEIRGQLGGLTPPAGQGGTFTDDDGSTHEGNIEVIAAAGITLGCNPPANDNFCGRDSLTRGQGAAFFARALNLPPVAGDFFTDDNGSTFETEINSIAAFGITVGCNAAGDNYCPNDTITRGQWASLLARALGLTAGAGDNLFTDDDGSVHEANIDRLGTAGITNGCSANNFCPLDEVRRDEAASFLARAMGWAATTP